MIEHRLRLIGYVVLLGVNLWTLIWGPASNSSELLAGGCLSTISAVCLLLPHFWEIARKRLDGTELIHAGFWLFVVATLFGAMLQLEQTQAHEAMAAEKRDAFNHFLDGMYTILTLIVVGGIGAVGANIIATGVTMKSARGTNADPLAVRKPLRRPPRSLRVLK